MARQCLRSARSSGRRVRDVGNFGGVWRRQKRTEAGNSPGPRMFYCGQILDGEGSKLGALAQKIRDPGEARPAVHRRADRGADFTKVYDWLSPDSLAAARDTARERGLRIVCHVPFSVTFDDAGVD